MTKCYLFRPTLKNLLNLFLSGLAVGILVNLPIQAQVIAQTQSQFSEEQIKRYAGAASAIERKRDEIWRRAKTFEGWNTLTEKADARGVTICGLKKSEQPGFIQNLCSELFDFSEQEIRRHGFSSNRDFNQITQAQQQNNQLQRRIQIEIVDLMRPKK